MASRSRPRSGRNMSVSAAWSGVPLWAAAGMMLGLAISPPALAEPSELQRLNDLERQIRTLQQELQELKRELAGRNAAVRAARAAPVRAPAPRPPAAAPAQPPLAANPFLPPPPAAGLLATPATAAAVNAPAGAEADQSVRGISPHPSFRVGPLTVTLGGFVEFDSIFRARNEVSDIASSWIGIPLNNVPQAHESEYRMSARRSRLAALIEGFPDAASAARAYIEADFLGAAPTANSVESNSYTPRLRQFYATYDRTDMGLHVLAGQAWSMITLEKIGIVPREELIPITIDQSYTPGFVYTRTPQLRLTTDLAGRTIWLGASLESPQTTFVVGPNGTGVPGGTRVNFGNPGGSQFFSGNSFSTDVAPDLIVKAAFDPRFGHYELYGLGRLLQSRTEFVGAGHNNVIPAGGGGGSFVVPLVPGGNLQLQGSVLAGAGIGRYGIGQLPDATIGRDGQPLPIPEVDALIGVIARPLPTVDIYSYIGTEREAKRAFVVGGKGFGYGSPLYSNAGCDVELSALPCTGNTAALAGGVIGAWWRFLHGGFGTMMAGASYGYVRRSVFPGAGGSPSANEQIFMAAFRYYPFE
jgi:hypothetical protein